MLKIGEIVNGRYRIEKQLGEGGMGIVYLGWDLVVERFVAMKEIKSSLPNYEKYIERIKKEAKMLARLNHSNIITLYDLIEYQDNWYIVMEYVEGLTLDKKLKRSRKMPYQEATPIFKQILAALEHAHQAGVIHRDIKPGNVMLKSDGQVKVMDFGLAKIQKGGSLTRSIKSESEATGGGTLYYLSPEQVETDGKVADHRSDIYSFGMTCYEVLTGYMPLKEKKTTVEILNAILRDNFPPPNTRNAKIPEKLSTIVQNATKLKPPDRFQSAGEMLTAVEKFEAEQADPKTATRKRIRVVLEIAWGLATLALILTLITVFAVPDLPLRILRWAGILSPTKMVIFTEPADAEIKFGGKSVGKSPLDSRYVDDDTLQISIQKATYFDIDTFIVLKGMLEKEKVLHFDLKPAAIFSIAVEPESAEVMINSRLIPPAEREHVELAVGEHDLHITAEGYESISETINLRQGLNSPRLDTLKQTVITALKPAQVGQKEQKPPLPPPPKDPVIDVAAETTAVATPVPTGILTLTINPPSEVYIGDSLAARAAAHADFTLPAGNYAVKVVHATMGRWQAELPVTESGAAREIDFTKRYEIRISAFDASARPLIAEIYLDGRPTGELTPYVMPINFGTHQLEIRLQGYAAKREEFNVEENVELEFILERLQ